VGRERGKTKEKRTIKEKILKNDYVVDRRA
jgi:hypothetical protein